MPNQTVLLGEAWGENEEKLGRAFVGGSGIWLLRMLSDSGFMPLTSEDWSFLKQYWNTGNPEFIDMVWHMHPEFYRTNVFNQRPPANKIEAFCGPKKEGIAGYPPLIKGKAVRAEFEFELERLGEELCEVNPNLILCLGNTPLWAMAGLTAISKNRGATRLSTHTVAGFKLLPTYHPAAVMRQIELRPTTVMDFNKASREAEFPEIRRLKREIWIEPTLEDLEVFYERYIQQCRVSAGPILSVDIETSGNQITSIGFSIGSAVAIVVPIFDRRKKDRNYWASQWDELFVIGFIRRILEDRSIRKLFQNGLYDIAFIWRSWGIRVFGAEEDTMLLSHALQPEALKGLGYLGSVFSDEGAWKNLRQKHTTIKRDD
mgnify:CR=1 FL=1